MGDVVELIAGAGVIKKEMDGLRCLKAALQDGRVVLENGIDVTAREVAILGMQIEALEVALRPFIGIASHGSASTMKDLQVIERAPARRPRISPPPSGQR